MFSGFLLLTVLLISGFGSPPDKTGRSSPQYKGIIGIPGLNDRVTVYRDERGMPHIYATCEHDLYLSQADTYIGGRFYQDHFSDEAVIASARYILVLKPEN